MAVFKKLLRRKGFSPVGLVRDKLGYEVLLKLGALPDQIKICDLRFKDTLTSDIFEGTQKAVLCKKA
jgi:hypothetical protein